MSRANEPTELSVVTGRYPFFEELRAEPSISPQLKLRFIEDYSPIHRAFRPMVRSLAFDVSEMALATYVQARAKGVPITLVPITVLSRFQHGLLFHDRCQGPLEPKGLEGRRVGVRAYSQTTGVWLRALLRSQFGVDTSRISWIVSEEAHVAGFAEPFNVTMSNSNSSLEQLASGELDALIGQMPENACLGQVIPDPDRHAREWYESNGYVPVNHILTVKESLLEDKRDEIKSAFFAFRASLLSWKSTSGSSSAFPEVDFYPLGFESLAPVLEAMAEEAAFQSLTPRRLTLDDLVHPFTRELA